MYPIPGGKEALRVNGRARILTDAPFFDAMAHDGRRPDPALVLDIDEICPHCPMPLRRSGCGIRRRGRPDEPGTAPSCQGDIRLG